MTFFSQRALVDDTHHLLSLQLFSYELSEQGVRRLFVILLFHKHFFNLLIYIYIQVSRVLNLLRLSGCYAFGFDACLEMDKFNTENTESTEMFRS